MSFKQNLKARRRQAGLTQQDMAKKAGVPLRTYQNWEAGTREPRLQALIAVAAALDLTVDELLQAPRPVAATRSFPGSSTH